MPTLDKRLSADLPKAIDGGQISAVFQPIIDAYTGDIVSVETLMRWAHPAFDRPIQPDHFIHLAERNGTIKPLTDHVLNLALAACRSWLDAGIRLPVAVNLSPHCLTDPHLVDGVREALARHAVPRGLLTFELTESSVIDATVRDSRVLLDLHGLGARLSMDDFGTGWSSLAQLRELPIDEVKIDKSFVLGMSTGRGELHIARAIIDLGHNLGVRVVAEGVEDEYTMLLLTQMGCDKLQGFLFSPPLPAERVPALVLSGTGVGR